MGSAFNHRWGSLRNASKRGTLCGLAGDPVVDPLVMSDVVHPPVGETEDVLGKVRDALPAELTSLVDSGSSGSLGGG